MKCNALVPILATLLAAMPGVALAHQVCELESTERLTLDDVASIKTLSLAIGPDTLQLEGNNQASGDLMIRKCASSDERLEALQVSLQQSGDQLTVDLDHGGKSNRFSFSWGKKRGDYGYFEVTGAVPQHWNLDIAVGSGSAHIKDVAAVKLVVGSGEGVVTNVSGEVSATVGSGDLAIDNVGTLAVGSIGSGELEASNIAGLASIDTIGSGEADLKFVGNGVHVGTIGSGELDITTATGSITVGTIGSGELDIVDVNGNVTVGTIGSGSVDARDIEGDFTLRSKSSGSVKFDNVAGTVSIPKR